MFKYLKKFFQWLEKKRPRFFDSFFGFNQIHSLTEDEKYAFVIALLSGQRSSTSTGFALRHVSSNETYDANLGSGFKGDAVSYSLTNHIMGLAINREVRSCVWSQDKNNEYYFSLNGGRGSFHLDKTIASSIFDVIHGKILQFITLNYNDHQPHHFMIIKDMQGALTPYDIKNIYPTGKCGKRKVAARQIAISFSKSVSLDTPEKMLLKIEKRMMKLYKPAKYEYSQQDTRAILSVLREIKVNSNDKTLTSADVRLRLTQAEYDHEWSESQYESFRGEEGFLSTFEELLPKINEDLRYFKRQI